MRYQAALLPVWRKGQGPVPCPTGQEAKGLYREPPTSAQTVSQIGLDRHMDFFYTQNAMPEKPKARVKRVKSGENYLFYMRPVDQRMIKFLQSKNTLEVSNVIRMALAFHAEALGMNIRELIEECASPRSPHNENNGKGPDDSTPA